MVLVTGGAGFIGSAYIKYLNTLGIYDIIVCDKFGTDMKWRNLRNVQFKNMIAPEEIFSFLKNFSASIDTIVHMGACSSTTEEDMDYLYANNVMFSQELWNYAQKKKSKFIYASSAATYGDGSLGYDDKLPCEDLSPLNKYGYSKQLFDLWVMRQPQVKTPWAGLKFFNVFGPNEYHKGSMASVVFHAYNQIVKCKKIRLFKSYRTEIPHGMQKRDFIYIKDAVQMIDFFRISKFTNGLYNIASGAANSFYDLALHTFEAMQIKPRISFIDMPVSLRDKYQYYTLGRVNKLQEQGYQKKMFSFHDAVLDYTAEYLNRNYKCL